MNLRTFTSQIKPYATFNREERNLAAIFFHALNLGDNTARFLQASGCRAPDPSWETAIYYEFAYIRDLWNDIESEQLKRDLILHFLRRHDEDRLRTCDTEAFNTHFGAMPKPSKGYIQSPGNWSVRLFERTIQDNDDFLATCMFKWSFNAKPDIVIQTGPDRCVCIEAKLESGEGQYPTSSEEKALFNRRGLPRVAQTDLQRYALKNLLGFDTEFLFLSPKPSSSGTHRLVTWGAAFDSMDTTTLPTYMKQTIAAMAG